MKRLLLPFLFTSCVFIAAFTGCKKDPLYIDLNKDTVITGNLPPQYKGVTNLQVRFYINKIYVDLIGREPTSVELNTKTNYLIQHNLDSAARNSIISELLNTKPYYDRLFEITSSYMLNSADSIAISQQLATIVYARHLDSLGGVTPANLYYTIEINRINKLTSVTTDILKGNIDIREYFRVFLDNYFFDQINMGSENFVKATFSDLYNRQPTVEELTQGVAMTDGSQAILFLQNGGSKLDFQNIAVGVNEFLEGLVRKSYLQFLLRQPESVEMAAGTDELSRTLDLPAFQKELIMSKEYAGF